MSYRYRPGVLEQLARHGVRPNAETPPMRIRDYLSQLYRYELRRLRGQVLRRELARQDYASLVVSVRRRYPLLSIPVELWNE
jgi:hypothetical protein